MRSPRLVASLVGGLAVASPLGCAPSPPAAGTTRLTYGTLDPCRGITFDADHPDPRCLHEGVSERTPPAEALQVTLESPAPVRSGYDAHLALDLRNVSGAPLDLDLDDACGTFEATASSEAARSFEADCLGLCDRGPEPHVLRVTLEPGGVVRKGVTFYAVQTRLVIDPREACVARTVGGLPPGDYALRVTLPWTDAVPEHPEVSRPRVFEGSLVVTP